MWWSGVGGGLVNAGLVPLLREELRDLGVHDEGDALHPEPRFRSSECRRELRLAHDDRVARLPARLIPREGWKRPLELRIGQDTQRRLDANPILSLSQGRARTAPHAHESAGGEADHDVLPDLLRPRHLPEPK